MKPIAQRLELVNVPSYVASWNAAKIPGFVLAVLNRWQRSQNGLPEQFFMVMCPQVEVNARGGLPRQVVEMTDPRLRCKHFTGCQRPYFVVLFSAEDGDEQRQRVQNLLPWSEGYAVQLTPDAVRLCFVQATEELDEGPEGPMFRDRLRGLLQSGDLIGILA